MRINVYVVDKKAKEKLYAPLVEHYVKLAKPFAKVEVHELFGKEVAKAQEISADAAKAAYTKLLLPRFGRFNVALDPDGKEVTSETFADLLKDRSETNFFIGGAYGFEALFLRQCDFVVSFGKITLSHKLVKVVLLEQIFRGLSINHNHPYHK